MKISTYLELEDVSNEIQEAMEMEDESSDILEPILESLNEILFNNREVKYKETYYSPVYMAFMGREVIPCPVCGNPPDSCQDHNHYYCEKCSSPLEFNTPNSIWMCEECDSCEHCGAPPGEDFCHHCK